MHGFKGEGFHFLHSFHSYSWRHTTGSTTSDTASGTITTMPTTTLTAPATMGTMSVSLVVHANMICY